MKNRGIKLHKSTVFQYKNFLICANKPGGSQLVLDRFLCFFNKQFFVFYFLFQPIFSAFIYASGFAFINFIFLIIIV